MSSYTLAIDGITQINNADPVANLFHHIAVTTNGAATAGKLSVAYRMPGESGFREVESIDLTSPTPVSFTDPVAEWRFTPADVVGAKLIYLVDTATPSGKPLSSREAAYFGANRGTKTFQDDTTATVSLDDKNLLDGTYTLFVTLSNATHHNIRSYSVSKVGDSYEFDFILKSATDHFGVINVNHSVVDGVTKFDFVGSGLGDSVTIKYLTRSLF